MAGKITLEFDNIMISLKGQVQQILHDNIDEFKKCISSEVHKDVYPAYSPKKYTNQAGGKSISYNRRGDSGGLSDVDNYDVVEGDLSLTLTNKTESGTDYWKYMYSVPITELVENGSGYGWVGVPARPFMDKGAERFAHEILEPQIKALGGGK